MKSRNVSILTDEQRASLLQLPDDISDRLLARYHTLSDQDLDAISNHRRDHNKLGFAVQLCLLRFPGRTLADLPAVPPRVLSNIAAQLNLPVSVFEEYGTREITLYEHVKEIRELYGFSNYGTYQPLFNKKSQ